MAGFASPSILFLNSWNEVERRFMLRTVKRLYATAGFNRAVEPCSGGFAMSLVSREAGFKPQQIEASDVSLYSCIMGHTFAGKPLEDLRVCLDGEPVKLTHEDPILNAAELLLVQVQARMAAKPRVHYWMELERDLTERRQEHLESLARHVSKQNELLGGLNYRGMTMWDHMYEVAGDPKAVILTNPPSYMGGYERFFDTKGRLTWDEIEYDVWNPPVDQPRFVEESREWDCTVLCIQLADTGNCAHPDPVYAHDKRRGANDYIWSNKPDLVRRVHGGNTAVPRLIKPPEKLDTPIIPDDYMPTESSEVGVQRLPSGTTRYYKDLWMHKIDFKQSSVEFGVFIDGHLAGLGGYGSELFALGPSEDMRNVLTLFYAVSPMHQELRLSRLVKMLAISRPVILATVKPWVAGRTDRVLTTNLTKQPEFKGNRGIFKLMERKKDPQYGYRLIYEAPVNELRTDETFQEWLKREKQWQRSRATTAV